MKADLLNLHEWIRRLGVRRSGWAPEFLETVQPVQVVGDVSALVPPLLPPTALSGGNHAAAAGRTFACQFRCRANGGGAFLRLVRLTCSATNVWFWFIGAPVVMSTTVVCPSINMGPDPVLSTFEVGDQAGVLWTATRSQNFCLANTPLVLDDAFFVPSGSVFYAENLTGAGQGLVSITWQEVP